MLVLTRKNQESIVINNDIKITVLELDREYQSVRIGIDAPKSVTVNREEIHKRIQRQKNQQQTSESI